MSNPTMRECFESWVTTESWLQELGCLAPDPQLTGEYKHAPVQQAWEIWQAACYSRYQHRVEKPTAIPQIPEEK